MKNKGFTLIELLVVISIIGLLAAAGLTVFTSANKRARDARKIADLKDIQTALYSFYTANNKMPANYNPCCGARSGTSYYDQSMQELVDAGYLTKIPGRQMQTGAANQAIPTTACVVLTKIKGSTPLIKNLVG